MNETVVPHNPEVEAALIGRLLSTPELTAEVVGTLLEAKDFYDIASRKLFETIVEAFYADEAIDPLTAGELLAKPLSRLWGVEERAAVQRVVSIAARPATGSPVDHAKLVKRDADYRELLKLSDLIRERVGTEKETPSEIAGITSQMAMNVTMKQQVTSELTTFEDAGREFRRSTLEAMEARRQGIELGAYYNLKAIDKVVKGHRGGELIIAGGEPGVGKSAVFWRAALSFARRQAARPAAQQVGTLVISLEMGQEPSNARFASMISGVSGDAIRSGTITKDQLGHVVNAWVADKEIPLYMNYAPTLRTSQLRALIAEGIRRYNIGLVVIDHFRMFDLDQRLPNRNDEDEEKVRFLKEQIAMSMNVAVVCLAHTRKPDQGSNGRPKMSDLRGSYQVAAHSDFVCFVFRPAMYATRTQIDDGQVKQTDAEMIWAKTRHGSPETVPFYFDGASMLVTD